MMPRIRWWRSVGQLSGRAPGSHSNCASAKGSALWQRLIGLAVVGLVGVGMSGAANAVISLPLSDTLTINGKATFFTEIIPQGGKEQPGPLVLNGNFGLWSVVLFDRVLGKDSGNSPVSDVLIAAGNRLLVGSDDLFHQNAPGGLPVLPNAIRLPEVAPINLFHFLPAGAFFIDPTGAHIPITSLVFVSEVPELATWLMMIIGFSLIAFRLRRDRSVASPVAT